MIQTSAQNNLILINLIRSVIYVAGLQWTWALQWGSWLNNHEYCAFILLNRVWCSTSTILTNDGQAPLEYLRGRSCSALCFNLCQWLSMSSAYSELRDIGCDQWDFLVSSNFEQISAILFCLAKKALAKIVHIEVNNPFSKFNGLQLKLHFVQYF